MRLTIRSRRRLASALLALAAVPLLSLVPSPASGDTVAGKAGTDTSLPATDSAVTVKGRGAFSSLEITVNQTEDLVNQAISVTWKGAAPTTGPGTFGQNYLQLMQCWGDPDSSVPDNPGPPPEQCVFGATNSVYGSGVANGILFPAGSFTADRIIGKTQWPGVEATGGFLEDTTGWYWRSFRAVDGTVVNSHLDTTFNPSVQGGSFWLNPVFNSVTTNEIAGARTLGNGTGAELFEVHTGVESSGLGCGQKVQPGGSGGTKVPRCWLVIVPRGNAAAENAGTGSPDNAGVLTSPLAPTSWKNRIAVPLEFSAVESACDITGEQRRIDGSELPIAAVARWQPQLCGGEGLPPFAYSPVTDDGARQQLVSGVEGAAGMIAVSRPIDQELLDPTRPFVYAPITLSGIVIGLNIERNPSLDAEQAIRDLTGVRVAELNLTPRLVAKLLTQSYRGQVELNASKPDYPWLEDNPTDLAQDPDFLRFNPEFSALSLGQSRNLSGLVLPSRGSDAARQTWEWVLADPEAKAWLAGGADEWGMKPNPAYVTDPGKNSLGVAFGDPVPTSFPKAEPYCFEPEPFNAPDGREVVPTSLCGTDWLPYVSSFRDAARTTRTANDGAKVFLDKAAYTPDQAWKREGPQRLGTRGMLSLTDTASAAQYGIQMARLSRAGDNDDDRDFVAPDAAGLAAGADAMAPKAEQAVREPDPLADATGAYPLTVLTYGAISPLDLDEQARSDYAAFVEYTAGDGQTAGTKIGQLPAGFVPLPAALRTQSVNAAKTIRTMDPVPVEDDEPVDEEEPEEAEEAVAAPATTTTTAPPAQVPVAAPVVRDRPFEVAPAPLPEVVTEIQPAASVSPGEEQTRIVSTIATPFLAVAQSRFFLPVLTGLALLSALGALEITKRPRRALVTPNVAGDEEGPST